MFININNMDAKAAQATAAGGTHLVLYDGVCALCNGLVQFLLTHDRRGIFRFTSLQSPTGQATVTRFGGNSEELTSLYVVKDYETDRARALTRSRAALFVLSELGWPWTFARVVGVLPTMILDRAYDAVARTRYRIFGRYDQCLAPRPEFRDRFVE
jgi:predicted DCC family thiol-disulfide oxidoreductase YuxK